MHILILHIVCTHLLCTLFFCEGVNKIPETIIKDFQKLQTDFINLKELCEKFEKNLDNLMSRAEMRDGTIPLITTSARQSNNETVASPRSAFYRQNNIPHLRVCLYTY